MNETNDLIAASEAIARYEEFWKKGGEEELRAVIHAAYRPLLDGVRMRLERVAASQTTEQQPTDRGCV